MASWAVDRIEDIPELEPVGDCPIRPVRHHFGITAFGVNAWTARAAGDRVINEHEEDPGSEELYIVTRGRAVFELDGERREAPEGTFVFVPAGVKRTAFGEEAGNNDRLGRRDDGQAVHAGWLGAVVSRCARSTRPVSMPRWRRSSVRSIAEAPQYGLLFYNLACLESLTGQRTEAIDHLRTSIELSEQFRDYAQQDSDLDAVRDDPAFEELMAKGTETPDPRPS